MTMLTEKSRKRPFVHLARLMAMTTLMFGLAACGGETAATAVPTPEPTVPPTVAVEPTAEVLPTAAPTVIPTPAITVTPTAATANCTNRAATVRDVTVPDDTVFKPGEIFTKTWRIQNSGTCAWGEGYSVVFFAGDRLEGAASTPIPATQAGQDAVITVKLTASFTPGKFQGFWKLRSAGGQDFGTGPEANIPFWVKITVRR